MFDGLCLGIARRAFLGILCLSVVVTAHTKEQWAERSIYQVLTDRFARSANTPSVCNPQDMKYCGGTWRGLQAQLDYIAGMGFNAIWISPVVQNTPDGYHGYWAKDLFSVNEHFGTTADLKALVQACHERDIWVMVDVVANHVGPQEHGNDDFAQYPQFNQAAYYHPFCEISQQDWDSMNQYDIEHCRLANLPDLDQDNVVVRSLLKKWIKWLVSEFGFDGIRIDTVPEVGKDFWKEFVNSSGVFAIGEVFNGNPDYVYPYADAVGSVLDYPLFFAMRDAFVNQGDMASFGAKMQDLAAASRAHGAAGLLGAFVDNHDNARFLCHTAGVQGQDWTLLKNALAALLLGRQIPVVYYGTEQGLAGCADPANREPLFDHHDPSALLYAFIAQLHAARRLAASRLPTFFASDPLPCPTDLPAQVLALARGELLLVASNFGSDALEHRVNIKLPPALQPPSGFVDLLDPSSAWPLQGESLPVVVRNGQPLLLAPADWHAAPGGELEARTPSRSSILS